MSVQAELAELADLTHRRANSGYEFVLAYVLLQESRREQSRPVDDIVRDARLEAERRWRERVR